MDQISFDLENIRRINLGHGNDRLDRCRQENIIIFGVVKKVYHLYLENKKEEMMAFFESQISSSTGRHNTKSTASRYINDLDFFCKADEKTLWISVGKNSLYWGSSAGNVEIIGDYTEDNPNPKDDRTAYLIKKKMHAGWFDRNVLGQKLDLWRMHPKAKDWLTQRGTIGRLNTAQYFLDLVNGQELFDWHNQKEMLEAANQVGWRENNPIPDVPRDWAFEVGRMASSILRTVANANGQEVIRTTKIKNCPYDDGTLQTVLRRLLLAQNFRCAITGRKLEIKNTGNPWLAASPDRIDSNGHYVEENLQIVSWAANHAKNDISPEDVDSYFRAIQFSNSD